MSSERNGRRHTIGLSGELDLATAPDVADELERVEATAVDIVVLDLSGLTFIDSTGIRLVLAAHRRAGERSLTA
jgi:anti-anti-sigma factor